MDEREKRAALIEAMLPDVPFDGWTRAALGAAAARIGIDEVELAALFPGGARDMVACFSRLADRRMLAALAGQELAAMKVRERVALAVRTRLSLLEPDREAVRRALSLLALPRNAALGLRLLYETVDAVWYAAGRGRPRSRCCPRSGRRASRAWWRRLPRRAGRAWYRS
jgi:ubiquinone biosynthesis protein COQ9